MGKNVSDAKVSIRRGTKLVARLLPDDVLHRTIINSYFKGFFFIYFLKVPLIYKVPLASFPCQVSSYSAACMMSAAFFCKRKVIDKCSVIIVRTCNKTSH